ncbi:hypothetical protein [Rhizobium sp. LC145]|jgi:hypothetical protein|uniref:hypothetical protein n=1 Tax=Rhizobium sp. LC145 TaxID=1120688 RepID=UPI0010C9BB5B|nr:hypothetical protein [Rhizobium sp. LC145]TKT46257.1 hypothetical protein FDR95_23005 [Rhizobiaceae bacterium LC148]
MLSLLLLWKTKEYRARRQCASKNLGVAMIVTMCHAFAMKERTPMVSERIHANGDDRHVKDSEWLKHQLEPALRADESEFIEVSAEDVIRRNKSQRPPA